MFDGPGPILKVSDLSTVFDTRDGRVHAVNGVSFEVAPGGILGVVGESGSGKSVTMMAVMGLLPRPPAEIAGGSILFEGSEVRAMSPRALRALRGGGIGMVFQDPMNSLNPVFTIGTQLAAPIRAHLGLGRRAARKRAAELLAMVGIPDPGRRLDDYPHQFSGGQRQRVMIAMALSCGPRLLIADEPTTALDVTIQAQILEVMRGLRRELGMAIIWITHDLGVVAGLADRVLVMYAGQVVEQGPVETIFADPRHPYTRALLRTVPDVTAGRARRLPSIEGQPPVMTAPPRSCAFAERCEHVFNRCRTENPPLIAFEDGHEAACWWDCATGAPRRV